MRKRKKESVSVTEDTSVVKQEKGKSQLWGRSWIGYLLDKLSSAVYKALISGFFGYIFASYYDELYALENGFIFHNLRSGSKPRKFLRSIRGYVSQSFETSYILRKLRKSVCGLADVSTKSYGRFTISFGIYTLLFYFVKLLLPALGTANADHFYIGMAVCAISIPLLISDKTIAQAAYDSRITKFIFADAFGYREELFETKDDLKSRRFSGRAMFFGLVLGVLTFFIHPAFIIGILCIFVACAFIFTSPEIGILIALFFLPFFALTNYPTLLLLLIMIATTISYIIKLIRGKRIIRIELVDLGVIFFSIILYFSGRITVGGKDSYFSALAACCLLTGYFLIVNLIRTEKWVKRCIYSLVFSGTVTAIIGIVQYALGYAVNDWLDVNYFSDIYGRATATFDNPNYLAAYLAIVFPFALYVFTVVSGARAKILAAVSCISIVACTVFTWSRAAWLAIIVCFVVYLLIITRKSLKYILGVILLTPLFSMFMPDNVINRFTSIGDVADSSTLYRIYTWSGCVNLIKEYFWGGIGYGQAAFEKVYPLYAFAGIETAVHSHNLYLQLLISMGIGGAIAFVIVMLFFTQNCLSYVRSPLDRDTSLITSASLTSVLSMLVIGLFDFVWYNNLVFFMFWAAMAIGVACTRVGRRELSRDNYVCDSFDNSASVNLYI